MTNQPTPPLVPDWICTADRDTWTIQGPRQKEAVLKMRYDRQDAIAYMRDGMDDKHWRELWPAMKWARKHGHLPTREDEHQAQECVKDSTCKDVIAVIERNAEAYRRMPRSKQEAAKFRFDTTQGGPGR